MGAKHFNLNLYNTPSPPLFKTRSCVVVNIKTTHKKQNVLVLLSVDVFIVFLPPLCRTVLPGPKKREKVSVVLCCVVCEYKTHRNSPRCQSTTFNLFWSKSPRDEKREVDGRRVTDCNRLCYGGTGNRGDQRYSLQKNSGSPSGLWVILLRSSRTFHVTQNA